MDLIDALAPLAKGEQPPAGFAPIPNSAHGGYRKRVGDRYQYWYPGGGSTPSAKGDDAGAPTAKPKQGAQAQKHAEKPDAKTLAIAPEFEKAIAEGKFKGTFQEHLEYTRAVLAQHEKDKDALIGDLKKLAPKGKIKARVKKIDSVLGKMVRKPKYQDASMLQDLTGSRIVLTSVDEVKHAVAAIKKKYKVVTEDNYIDTPQGDYRSHHLIVEHNGQQKEIQVRTGNQDQFADWAHNVYKPVSAEQEAAMRSSAHEIEAYSKAAADFFWAKDSGASLNPPYPPPCTTSVKNAFGCLDFGGME